MLRGFVVLPADGYCARRCSSALALGAEPVHADDGRAAQLDEPQARADQAARRIGAQRAELDASSEHAARIEREAQAEPAAERQAVTHYDMEMER